MGYARGDGERKVMHKQFHFEADQPLMISSKPFFVDVPASLFILFSLSQQNHLQNSGGKLEYILY